MKLTLTQTSFGKSLLNFLWLRLRLTKKRSIAAQWSFTPSVECSNWQELLNFIPWCSLNAQARLWNWPRPKLVWQVPPQFLWLQLTKKRSILAQWSFTPSVECSNWQELLNFIPWCSLNAQARPWNWPWPKLVWQVPPQFFVTSIDEKVSLSLSLTLSIWNAHWRPIWVLTKRSNKKKKKLQEAIYWMRYQKHPFLSVSILTHIANS
jgi:hypothetical protein